jgi:hypothetical protein
MRIRIQVTYFITKAAALLVISMLAQQAFAQSCGSDPNLQVRMDSSFYKAYQKLATSSTASNGGANVAVPIDGVPVAFGMQESDRATNSELQTLTDQEALTIVKSGIKQESAAIIAECGYRMCMLAEQNSDAGTQAISQVCNLAIGTVQGNASPLTVSPQVVPIVFGSSPQRTVSLKLQAAAVQGAQGALTVRLPDATDHLALSDQTQPVVIQMGDSVRLRVKASRPTEVADEFLEFDVQGAANATASVHFKLVPSAVDLLPDASISCGTLWPEEYIDVNSDVSRTFPTKRETKTRQDLTLAPGVSVNAEYDDNYASNGGGAARVDASAVCLEPQRGPDAATTLLNISGSILAVCGHPSGTGEQPGGGGALYPHWTSTLSLPGFPHDHRWDVTVDPTNGLAERQPGRIKCSINIDNGDTRDVSVGSHQALSFRDLTPGTHVLALDCSGPAAAPDELRSQNLCLGPNGQSRTVPVAVSLKAAATRRTLAQQ